MVSQATDSAGLTPDKDLRSCLEEQTMVFRDAVGLLEELESRAQQRETGEPESIRRLQRSLDRVVQVQQKVMAAHSRFSDQRGGVGADLRKDLKQHEDLLKTLIERIDRLQHVFEDVRSELIPQLDMESRRRHMQAAYSQSLKTL